MYARGGKCILNLVKFVKFSLVFYQHVRKKRWLSNLIFSLIANASWSSKVFQKRISNCVFSPNYTSNHISHNFLQVDVWVQLYIYSHLFSKYWSFQVFQKRISNCRFSPNYGCDYIRHIFDHQWLPFPSGGCLRKRVNDHICFQFNLHSKFFSEAHLKLPLFSQLRQPPYRPYLWPVARSSTVNWPLLCSVFLYFLSIMYITVYFYLHVLGQSPSGTICSRVNQSTAMLQYRYI